MRVFFGAGHVKVTVQALFFPLSRLFLFLYCYCCFVIIILYYCFCILWSIGLFFIPCSLTHYQVVDLQTLRLANESMDRRKDRRLDWQIYNASCHRLHCYYCVVLSLQCEQTVFYSLIGHNISRSLQGIKSENSPLASEEQHFIKKKCWSVSYFVIFQRCWW